MALDPRELTPRLGPIPDLAALDEPARRALLECVRRLDGSLDQLTSRILRLYREQLPDYDVIPDDEIVHSTRIMLRIVVTEAGSFRLPDAATRDRLEELALRRASQGLPLEVLAQGYQLGSREMLSVVDAVARDVGLPPGLVLAIHDSTWHFANEAAGVFARVQRELTVARARFDAERRSTFARSLLDGSMSVEQVHGDAVLFGLDPRAQHVVVVFRSRSGEDDTLLRTMYAGTGFPSQSLVANLKSNLVCISRTAPRAIPGTLAAVGPPEPLGQLRRSFDEAMLALETAERFGLTGMVSLSDLGPKPLALGAPQAAEHLRARHLAALQRLGDAGADIAETARVFLDCDLSVPETARRLTVHGNTVRYRMNRFRDLSGLDHHRTEDLVTMWWLLNGDGPRRTDGRIG